nr:hypothetical protein [Treponemataceae bacterium]
MRNTLRKFVIVIPVCLALSFVAMVISYMLLHNEAMTGAVFGISFCVFFTVQFFVFKLIDAFYPRRYAGREDQIPYGIFRIGSDEKVCKAGDYLSIKFDLSESGISYSFNIDDEKTFFSVCDVLGSKVSSEIVNKILVNTVDSVTSPEELDKIMNFMESSIALLNMKGVEISVLVGIVDNREMKLKYINASVYDIYVFQKKSDKKHIPLFTNRYKVCSEKQLPYI